MLEPVAPEVFYDTPQGQQLLDILAGQRRVPSIAFSQLYEVSDDPGEATHAYDTLLPGYSGDRLEKLARHLNANYDPATNRCTLYRLVGPELVQDFEEHGAITSRLVKSFGNYDYDLAVESLDRAINGDILGHVKTAIESTFADLEERIARFDMSNPDHVDHIEHLGVLRKETEALALGKPSNATLNKLSKKLSLLRKAQHLGREAYLAVLHEVGDDEAEAFPGSIGALIHSTIHLTSDTGFIDTLNSWGPQDHSGLLRVNFVPGRLRVGTGIGYFDGSYILRSSLPDQEYEWFGIGQLAMREGEVEITATKL